MESAQFVELFGKFRDNIVEKNFEFHEFPAVMGETLAPLAYALNVGSLTCALTAPVSQFAPSGEDVSDVFYHDKERFPVIDNENAIAEVYTSKEGGLCTVTFNPIKGHEFTDEETQILKIIASEIFIMGGRARMMEFMNKATSTDAMTGAINQMTLMNKLGAITARGILGDFCGIFINLKNFKYVNKSMSSAVGDLTLKIFVGSVCETLKEDECFCRLGGDNFYALLKKTSLAGFMERFGKFHVKFNQGPKPLEFVLQSRMGIYLAKPKDGPSEMMNNASTAYNVSRELKNTDVVYFSNDMLIRAMHRREISSEFRNALAQRQFVVHYQPKVDLGTKEICGSEALVRWIRHKTIVPPMDFIPILEQEGSICQLDFYVFSTVCMNIQNWLEQGIQPVRTSVNFSKLHLRNPDFADDILAIMKTHKVEGKYIEVELTEVSDYEDSLAMQKFINVMRQNGIAVSIDDFGTGYSTLNVLKNFNVDVIKLDKSLLDNIGKHDSNDEVVVKNVVNMAKEMNKDVIAEGVESEIQAKFLANVNCTKVQGFLFDKPLSHDDFQKRLTREKTY